MDNAGYLTCMHQGRRRRPSEVRQAEAGGTSEGGWLFMFKLRHAGLVGIALNVKCTVNALGNVKLVFHFQNG